MSEKKAKKSSIVKPFIVLFVAIAGGAVWYTQARTSGPLASEPFYFEMQSIVVNIESRSPRNYLKIRPVIVTRHTKLSTKLDLYRPALRNYMIANFRNESIDTLAEKGSYERLRRESLSGIRTLLQSKTGIQSVDDLLFTEFVIQ